VTYLRYRITTTESELPIVNPELFDGQVSGYRRLTKSGGSTAVIRLSSNGTDLHP
jgi:hypothetical protein